MSQEGTEWPEPNRQQEEEERGSWDVKCTPLDFLSQAHSKASEERRQRKNEETRDRKQMGGCQGLEPE